MPSNHHQEKELMQQIQKQGLLSYLVRQSIEIENAKNANARLRSKLTGIKNQLPDTAERAINAKKTAEATATLQYALLKQLEDLADRAETLKNKIQAAEEAL